MYKGWAFFVTNSVGPPNVVPPTVWHPFAGPLTGREQPAAGCLQSCISLHLATRLDSINLINLISFIKVIELNKLIESIRMD
jgi:hypothetical protein